MKVLISHITMKKKMFNLTAKGAALDIPEIDGEISAILEIYKMGEKYYASGTVTANARFQCDLCLDEFTQEISEPIAVYISYDSDESTDDFIPLAHNDVEIDFSAYIRETLLLAYPYTKKCRSDCKGLDAITGLNLNRASAPAKEERADPRWEKLKLIRSQINL